jgi:lysozyme
MVEAPKGARRVSVAGRFGGRFAAAVLALAIPLVSAFEGYVPHTYADPVGIPTACYGHTGADVTPGRTYSDAECAALLRGDLGEAYEMVRECIHVPLTPGQAAALTSAAFNLGPDVVCGSTLGGMANAGRPASEWCPQLRNKVDRVGQREAHGVKVLPGLVKRREAETQLCLVGS